VPFFVKVLSIIHAFCGHSVGILWAFCGHSVGILCPLSGHCLSIRLLSVGQTTASPLYVISPDKLFYLLTHRPKFVREVGSLRCDQRTPRHCRITHHSSPIYSLFAATCPRTQSRVLDAAWPPLHIDVVKDRNTGGKLTGPIDSR
jgi:hypothetical protein